MALPFYFKAWWPATLFMAVIMAWSPRAEAQNLMSLYEAARAFDASYLAARSLADSAIFKADQAQALLRPTVAATASLSHTNSDTADNQRSSKNSGTSLRAVQPLLNRANETAVAQAQKLWAIAQHELSAAEQDLIIRTAQAYFDVLAAQDNLATTQTSKKAISEQLASAKRNFEVGTTTITDTREAQARFDLASAQEIAAANDLRNKRMALDQLVGQSDIKPKSLITPVQLPLIIPADIDHWVGLADSKHPSVQRARLNLEIAQLDTEKARAGHFPTLDAIGSLSHSRAPSTASSGNVTSQVSSVSVQLNVPLYSGALVQNRIKETWELQTKARHDLDAARRAVGLAARQSFLGVQSGRAQVFALEAAESSSQLALEATQLGYTVGVRVNLDVLNAQTQLYTTRRDLAKARYDYLLSSLKLRQAAGQLQPQDLAGINLLLEP
jgi:outer membrane protein